MSKAVVWCGVVWFGLVVAGGRKALLEICQHASYLLVTKREMDKVGQRTMQSPGGGQHVRASSSHITDSANGGSHFAGQPSSGIWRWPGPAFYCKYLILVLY